MPKDTVRKNHTHSPYRQHLTTCQNTEENNNRIWLNNYVEKNIENKENNVGKKAETLEIIHKQNAPRDSMKETHAHPPDLTFNHLSKHRKNPTKHSIH